MIRPGAHADSAPAIDDAVTVNTWISTDPLLRCVLETIPDAMIVTNGQGDVLSFCRAAEGMFGYRESDLLGKNISILMSAPDHLMHEDQIPAYLTARGANSFARERIITVTHRDGKHFPVDMSIGRAALEHEAVFLVFMRDLSERTKALRRLNILQAELAQVSRISSMGMLASALAHELNQPLSVIANYSETILALAKQGSCDLEMVEMAMQQCTQEAMRAGEVIRRLRGFLSRGDIESSRVSLREIIGDAIALGLADGEGAGIVLSFDYDVQVDIVFADRVQIQQVVLNLVRNAAEAIAGQRKRSISVRTLRRGEDFAEVVVSDNGPGIEPLIARRLFQPFQSTKSSGMGIGLSICHTIIEGHGGKIWVEASALGGTAFHFTLPILQGKLLTAEN
jgi:two-component system sensor kinase FixL